MEKTGVVAGEERDPEEEVPPVKPMDKSARWGTSWPKSKGPRKSGRCGCGEDPLSKASDQVKDS